MNGKNDFNEEHTKEMYDRMYHHGDIIEGTFIETLEQHSLLHQYELYFIREIDRNLHSLLSIEMGLYQKVLLLDYPKDPVLLEAYDLENNVVLTIFVVSAVTDAYLYTDSKGYEKLLSLSGNDGKIHFVLENEWDEMNNKFKVKIRFSIHAIIAIQWNKKTDKGDGAYLVKLSFNRKELIRK